MARRSHFIPHAWGLACLFALALFWSGDARAQTTGPLPDYVIKEFGQPPVIPAGPISDGLLAAMQLAFVDSFTQSSWEEAQSSALAEIVASNDPRLAWLISDMMRFVSGGSLNQTLTAAAADLLNIDPPAQNQWDNITNHLTATQGVEYSFGNGAIDYMTSNVYAELDLSDRTDALGTLDVGAEVWVNGVAYTVTALGGGYADINFDGGAGPQTISASVATYTLSNGIETIFASMVSNPGDNIPEGAEILGYEFVDVFFNGSPQSIGYNDSGTDKFTAVTVNEADASSNTANGTDLLDASDEAADQILTFSANATGTLTNGTDTVSFTGIEQFQLGAGNDLADASVTTEGTYIHAGAGDDTLIGGTGADTLSGGAGSDTFVLGDAYGNDVIDGDGVPDAYVQIKSVMISEQLNAAEGV
jgi:Ca2+-binding RTX toxin-like protein